MALNKQGKMKRNGEDEIQILGAKKHSAFSWKKWIAMIAAIVILFITLFFWSLFKYPLIPEVVGCEMIYYFLAAVV